MDLATVTDTDKEAMAMIDRGEAILKAADRTPARPDMSDGRPVDWAATAADHATRFDTMAKDRAKEKGVSYARAYSDLLAEHPDAAQRAMAG
jgi:hypothetical protein